MMKIVVAIDSLKGSLTSIQAGEAIEKGIKKGKIEEQRLIAANFKKQGINIETIAQCTGLSVKEVSEL